jgi:hypothetical protein
MTAPQRFTFTLRNLLTAILWLAVVLGLWRLYPSTDGVLDDLITFQMRRLPRETMLNFAIIAAFGGAIGAMLGQARRGLTTGAVIGGGVALVWLMVRMFVLMQAANSV